MDMLLSINNDCWSLNNCKSLWVLEMGTTERKERERQKRRQDIIDAACKVLSEKGFANATVLILQFCLIMKKCWCLLLFSLTKRNGYAIIF